jgi:hypothetical protein
MTESYRYCRCEREAPRSPGPDWDITPDRGWCHACDHEVPPNLIRRTYAQALQAMRDHKI